MRSRRTHEQHLSLCTGLLLNRERVHRRTPRRRPLHSKNKNKTKPHNATGKRFCGLTTQKLSHSTVTKERIANIKSSQWLHTVEGGLWFGLVSLPPGLVYLPSRGEWIPKLHAVTRHPDIILQDNVIAAVCQLKLSGSWMMQQNNDLKC